MKKIEPNLAGGLRDYLPEDMIPRQEMLDKIRAIFETFGFAPLDTPALEKEAILTGGDKEFNKQIFKIKNSEKLALRFDLTVPLARVVASHNLGRPFKRYQMGKVWRGENQQFGRYREFMQCDADIVGSSSLMADAEIISLIYEVISALGITNFTIKVNDRKILNNIFSKYEIPQNKYDSLLRTIDKLDKIGVKEVTKQLEELVGKKRADEIMADLVKAKAIKNQFDNLVENLNSLGVPQNKWMPDLSVVRGLEYYTGIVFETVLNDLPEIGSVCSGGRYDGLVERFSNAPVSAVGLSIGVDRLFAALEKLGKIKKRKTISEALVLNFDKACESEALKIASDLRRANIKTDLYLGKEETFKGQFAYGVSHEYPVLVMYGSKEKESGLTQVRDMKAGKQTGVNPAVLISHVKAILG